MGCGFDFTSLGFLFLFGDGVSTLGDLTRDGSWNIKKGTCAQILKNLNLEQ